MYFRSMIFFFLFLALRSLYVLFLGMNHKILSFPRHVLCMRTWVAKNPAPIGAAVVSIMSGPSFHTKSQRVSLSLAFTDGQTSPHKPRLVVPHSTCPSLSPSPPAHSLIIGPAVINTHTLGGLQIPRWLGSDHSQRSPIGLVVFGLGSCGFRGNVMIQVEDCRTRRRSWSRFPLTRSCPELLVVGSGTSHLGVLG